MVATFLKSPAAVALNDCIKLKSKSHMRQKKGTVTLYFEDVTFLLKAYVTDDVISETDADMMCFTLASTESPTE